MTQAPVRRIVIAGGGTAGWMAAALLARLMPPPFVEIILVESDEIGTVGVGEATVPLITQFNGLLGIDEPDFVARTNGTFKLGIEFRDWGEAGNVHFHGFGDYGDAIQGVAPHHHWLKLHEAGETAPIEDWSMPYAAARRDRFAPPEAMKGEAAFFKYAYHFDAGLYARYLRGYAEARGVRRREGRIADVELDPESGNVASLTMQDGGEVIAGGFFIDCSGFVGLLISRALGVGYVDWSHLLPCDRAVAVGCERRGRMTPFTRSTARAAGWQWRIPLQHRIGNGHVYASAFISDDEAVATLLDNLDGAPLGEPRLLRFTTGHREKFWHRNVVAIGLAAGFMEPLESSSIQLIQTGLARLVEMLPDMTFDPVLIDEYNRVTTNEYERIRDFLILHYCRSRRPEAMWAQCRAAEIPEPLARKIAVWEAGGRVPLYSEESYQEPSWVSIFLGNGILPRRYDPIVDQLPIEHLRGGMAQRRGAIARAAETMPDHATFLARCCPAPLAA
ncbi:MAG: tryptophan halogenase family protein [Sphingomonas sp.]|jgi:tryptophan halogenase|uniref:tryptophan halogenase family protein n=1 Tax=Sphingomonas sp. TaxID=28214 RepID=UPI00356435E6